MTHRGYRALLAGLLIAVGSWSTALVLLDNRPLEHDPVTNLVPTVMLRRALTSAETDDWRRWVLSTEFRPPLACVVNQPAAWLLPDQVVAVRLTEVALFLLALWMVFRLGVHLSGPAAGLLAALLFAAFPMAQGWSRMGNADPLIWVTLLLLFGVLLELDLRSPWQAAALGLVAGLCAATRLLALPYLVGPLLWVLLFKVRDRRSAINLAAAAAWALNVAGWWYIAQSSMVVRNLFMSSDAIPHPLQQEITTGAYLRAGFGWVVGGALVAGVIALRRRLLSRQHLVLYAAWIGVPLLQFLLLWAIWERYLVPLVPQCALLVAVVVERATASWPAPRRRAAWGGAIALGLVPLLAYYGGAERLSSGLMRPDTRRFDALERVLAHVPAGEPVLAVDQTGVKDHLLARGLTRRTPRNPLVTVPDEGNPHAFRRETRLRYVLRALPRCEPESREPCGVEDYWWAHFGRALSRRRVASAVDPDGRTLQLYRLDRSYTGETLPY